MRIAYTSDLHSDATPANRALLPHLARRMRELEPDVVVIAGDVAETTAEVEFALAHFTDIGALRLYVAGNHDLFVEGEPAAGRTSRDKFARDLPAAAARAGFAALGRAPAACGGTAFVGVPGWYDYSLRDPRWDGAIDRSHYRAGTWRGIRAFDRGHVFWPAALPRRAGAHPAAAGEWALDEEIHAWMHASLRAQLQAVEPGRRIVAVVHVLPFAALVQRGCFGDTAFHDAYLGSAALGDLLLADARVAAVISGHLHRPADLRVGHLRVLARPVGTLREPAPAGAAVAADRCGVLDLA